MALNHKKVNGIKKSPSDHVKLKTSPTNGEKKLPLSTRSSPRSPRRPLTETLEVDVDLANSKFNSVSPGRRCVSDSRVNVTKKSDIPPTSTRKRKLDFDCDSKILTSKLYKTVGKEGVGRHGHMTRLGGSGPELDANQNIKEEHSEGSQVFSSGNHFLALPTNSQYKSQHRIGRRKAANSFFSYSETTLSSPWKISGPKSRTKSSGNLADTPLPKNVIDVDCSQGQGMNGEISSETSSEQDSVFEEDQNMQNGLLPRPKATASCPQKKAGAGSGNIAAPKRKVGRPRKSESGTKPVIKSEEEKPLQSVVPLNVPRTRRLASLDAETKVHLMFEREAVPTVEVKKSKTGRKMSHGTTAYSSQKSTSSSCEVEMEDITDHSGDDSSVTLSQSSIPNIPTECNIAGKVTCLNCGSETPAIYVHPPPSGENGLGVSPITSVTLPPNHLSLIPPRCKEVSSPLSDLFNDPDSLMKALSQLAERRRASVDSAECDHLKTLFKSRLTHRLSRHSVSEGEMERISSTLANQLSSLINTQNTIPLSPSMTATSNIARQKLIRKIVKPAGLKPAKEKLGRKKSTNGWRGVGDPVARPIVYLNESERELRYCYESIRRKEDVIKVRDCVLLRSGSRKKDIPFVAKISAIFEDPDTGEIMISLLWFYRPEHTESGRQPEHVEQELFACRHWDVNNVACIEDKCYVLPMSEYCRFQSELKREMEGTSQGIPVVPELPPESRLHEKAVFTDTAPENVFVCRQVYDYKQRRLLKNPLCKLT